MSVPKGRSVSPGIITCLSPWGQTGAIPSRLALFARPAPPASGLDRMSPVRQGLALQVRTSGNVMLYSAQLGLP
jgi:hypothetical protein